MPEIPEDDVEAVARALSQANGKDPDVQIVAGRCYWTAYESDAEAAIRTLIERGWGDVSAERERCLDICRAHFRDDGTAQAIAKAIEEK